MTAAEVTSLLAALRERAVELTAADGKLRWRAPAGAFSDDLRDAVKRHRDELVAALSGLAEPPVAREGPLSFAQERMWFLSTLVPYSRAYAEQGAIRLVGPLDEGSLAGSLADLVERHEILRTTFAERDGVPVQVVGEPFAVDLPLSKLLRSDAVQQFADIQLRQPFDLSTGPLFRVALGRLSPTEHVLVVTSHHIVGDAWSWQVFTAEVAAAYDARRKGERAMLPPLRAQYLDIAVRERARLASGELQAAVDYWRGRLAGVSTLEIPTDRPRPPLQQFDGGAVTERLPRQVADAIRQFGREQRATPYMVFLASFAALLRRVSRSPDIIVGTPRATRSSAADEALMGPFINDVVLRVDASGPVSFRDLVARARTVATEAYGYGDVPFEVLVEALQPTRDLSRHPIFTVAFLVHDRPVVGMQLAEVAASVVPLEARTAKFDLTLVITAEPDGSFTAALEYATALFDRATASDLVGRLRSLLEAALEAPDTDVTRLDVIGPVERRRLTEQLNDTAAPFPDTARLHQLFDTQADQQPDAPAVVVDGGTDVSYSTLRRCAHAIAADLASAGVGRGDLVGVVMEKGWEQAAAVLGVHAAGAAYLPIDPSLPAERVRYLFSHGGASVALTQPAVADTAGWPEGVRTIAVTQPPEGADDAPLPLPQSSTDLAYVIYTSGSTGLPKGVMIDHRGAVNTVIDVNNRWSVGPADRVLAMSSLSFDLSVYDVFGVLGAGGSIVFPSPDGLRDPAHWADLVARHGVTVWNSVPALVTLLVEYAEGRPEADLSSLRLVLMSGDWIPVGLPDRIRRLAPRAQVVSLGGATEASIWSICYPIESVDPSWTSIPYGRPMTNQRFYVLDEHMAPSPVGVPGELYIGGVGVALGYWRDPERTAARFVVHPQTGERLYRTGDLGRWRRDGTIEFLGREDFQVKVHGYRIELGEIETTLEQHADVAAAVVAALGDARGSRRLVAYVVTEGGAQLDPAQLRTHLKERLPEYMVPSGYVAIDALPLSPNGKVDRSELPDPGAVGRANAAVRPRTPLEASIAAIWSDLLEQRIDDVEADFFSVGGHSLLAARLVARIRAVLDVDVSLREVFTEPTVAGLSSIVGRRRLEHAAPDTGVMPVDPAARHEPFPLTDIQGAYLVGERGTDVLAARAHVYEEHEIGDVDLLQLRTAAERLTARHDVLRLVVDEAGSARTLPTAPPLHIGATDLSDRSDDEAAAALVAVRTRMTREGPEVSTGRPFQLHLTRLPRGVGHLHVSVSLLVADAASAGLLFSELATLLDDPDADLSPIACTYRDFATWTATDSDGRAADETWWRRRLPDLPVAPLLPLTGAPPAISEMTRHTVRLAAQPWDAVRQRARRAGVSETAVLLTLYAQLLAAAGAQDHFLLTVLHGQRPDVHPDLATVVGNFTSTLLLDVDLDVSESFEQRARRLQGRMWEDLDHSRYSGVRVAGDLNRLRGTSGDPVAPVVFASALDDVGSDGAPTFVTGALQTPQVWIDHNITVRNGALHANFDVADGLFEPAFISQLVEAYERALNSLASDDEVWAAAAEGLVAPFGRGVPIDIATAPQRSEQGSVSHAPPETLVDDMRGAFAQVLERQTVAAGDDFFTLGGSSLLALRLVSEVEHRTGTRLPISAIAAGPTPQRLAATLVARRVNPTPLTTLAGDDDAPIAVACVHGIGGTLLPFAGLARALHDRGVRRVVGFEAAGLSPGSGSAAVRIEHMAQRYLDALTDHGGPQTVDEPAPILLGWSLGAVVAYDMAQRLLRQGRVPGGVLLLDPPAPGTAAATAAVGDARIDDVIRAGEAALISYRPEHYPGPVVLLRSDQTSAAAAHAWSSLAPATWVETLSADHDHLLSDPAVGAVVAAAQRLLDEATS